MTPKVKPLEWRHERETNEQFETWLADSLLGRYFIINMPAGWTWFMAGGKVSGERPCLLKTAKAEAYADYEARILSALEATGAQS
jgi:hypothetical protein